MSELKERELGVLINKKDSNFTEFGRFWLNMNLIKRVIDS